MKRRLREKICAGNQKKCGKHPRWLITDHAPLTGEKQSIAATGPIADKFWLPSIDPRVYTIRCEVCNGASEEARVEVFPPDKAVIEVEPLARQNLGGNRLQPWVVSAKWGRFAGSV